MAINSKRQMDLDLRSQGFMMKETIPLVLKLLKTLPRNSDDEQSAKDNEDVQ